jgi:predicted dinucleotide-binding enzyme
MVIVAIPTKNVPDLLPGLFANVPARVVVDATHYHRVVP